MKFRELKLKKDPDCPVCGTHPTVTELIDYEQFCGVAPAATEVAVSTANSNETETDVTELKRKIDAKEDFFLLDVREPNEFQIGRIPGSTLIPLGEVPQRVERDSARQGNHRPLQDGRPQREGGGVPAAAGLHEREEPEGRASSTGRTRSTRRCRSIDLRSWI